MSNGAEMAPLLCKHKNTTAAFRHKNLIKRNVKIKQLPSPGRVRSAH